eukprot:COSAG01_NODE_1905_length_8940_cov_19.008936_3_plen_94_part_00
MLAALDFVEAHNLALAGAANANAGCAGGGAVAMTTVEVPVFRPVYSYPYPAGFPMVHPSLQDRDFERLEDGDPVLMRCAGLGCRGWRRPPGRW